MRRMNLSHLSYTLIRESAANRTGTLKNAVNCKLKTRNCKLLSNESHRNPAVYIQHIAGRLFKQARYKNEAGIGDIFG
jgi:hypothetical protein